MKALEGLSANKGGNNETGSAAETDSAKPAFAAPSASAPSQPPPEKPNYMADVLARHERISNRVNSKK
ncbi:MAG: hypothetical protein K2I30_01050 [Clostridia bacterium]|nr:hypothetical protein [Clostridia bacterium]